MSVEQSARFEGESGSRSSEWIRSDEGERFISSILGYLNSTDGSSPFLITGARRTGKTFHVDLIERRLSSEGLPPSIRLDLRKGEPIAAAFLRAAYRALGFRGDPVIARVLEMELLKFRRHGHFLDKLGSISIDDPESPSRTIAVKQLSTLASRILPELYPSAPVLERLLTAAAAAAQSSASQAVIEICRAIEATDTRNGDRPSSRFLVVMDDLDTWVNGDTDREGDVIRFLGAVGSLGRERFAVLAASSTQLPGFSSSATLALDPARERLVAAELLGGGPSRDESFLGSLWTVHRSPIEQIAASLGHPDFTFEDLVKNDPLLPGALHFIERFLETADGLGASGRPGLSAFTAGLVADNLEGLDERFTGLVAIGEAMLQAKLIPPEVASTVHRLAPAPGTIRRACVLGSAILRCDPRFSFAPGLMHAVLAGELVYDRERELTVEWEELETAGFVRRISRGFELLTSDESSFLEQAEREREAILPDRAIRAFQDVAIISKGRRAWKSWLDLDSAAAADVPVECNGIELLRGNGQRPITVRMSWDSPGREDHDDCLAIEISGDDEVRAVVRKILAFERVRLRWMSRTSGDPSRNVALDRFVESELLQFHRTLFRSLRERAARAAVRVDGVYARIEDGETPVTAAVRIATMTRPRVDTPRADSKHRFFSDLEAWLRLPGEEHSPERLLRELRGRIARVEGWFAGAGLPVPRDVSDMSPPFDDEERSDADPENESDEALRYDSFSRKVEAFRRIEFALETQSARVRGLAVACSGDREGALADAPREILRALREKLFSAVESGSIFQAGALESLSNEVRAFDERGTKRRRTWPFLRKS